MNEIEREEEEFPARSGPQPGGQPAPARVAGRWGRQKPVGGPMLLSLSSVDELRQLPTSAASVGRLIVGRSPLSAHFRPESSGSSCASRPFCLLSTWPLLWLAAEVFDRNSAAGSKFRLSARPTIEFEAAGAGFGLQISARGKWRPHRQPSPSGAPSFVPSSWPLAARDKISLLSPPPPPEVATQVRRQPDDFGRLVHFESRGRAGKQAKRPEPANHLPLSSQ